MLFTLTNAPASFQEMIDAMLKDMAGCVKYFNNIPIYGGNTNAKYQAIGKKVLQQCITHGLVVNLLKSEFLIPKTMFLGHVIYSQDVKMDLVKLKHMSK